jgi:hypothetical protein
MPEPTTATSVSSAFTPEQREVDHAIDSDRRRATSRAGGKPPPSRLRPLSSGRMQSALRRRTRGRPRYVAAVGPATGAERVRFFTDSLESVVTSALQRSSSSRELFLPMPEDSGSQASFRLRGEKRLDRLRHSGNRSLSRGARDLSRPYCGSAPAGRCRGRHTGRSSTGGDDRPRSRRDDMADCQGYRWARQPARPPAPSRARARPRPVASRLPTAPSVAVSHVREARHRRARERLGPRSRASGDLLPAAAGPRCRPPTWSGSG